MRTMSILRMISDSSLLRRSGIANDPLSAAPIQYGARRDLALENANDPQFDSRVLCVLSSN